MNFTSVTPTPKAGAQHRVDLAAFHPLADASGNELHNEAFNLLQLLGYTGLQTPLLFDLFWKVTANRLDGPVIQEGPLSRLTRCVASRRTDHNYIEWLYE